MINGIEKFTKFYESKFGKNILEKEAQYIHRELKGCKKILDAGCGTGLFEQELSDLNIVGLDCSKGMLEEARKRSNKNFVLGDAGNLCFKDSCFDAVFYVTVLEFLSDYQNAVKEAHRATKQHGKILIMMLNPESEYFHEHKKKEDSYFRRIRHADLGKVGSFISNFYDIYWAEYFLGINRGQVFDTSDKRFASLYVIAGIKNNTGASAAKNLYPKS